MTGGTNADNDPGGLKVFGGKVYFRGGFDDCPWIKLYDRCLIKEGRRPGMGA